jgi:hypothetical protein
VGTWTTAGLPKITTRSYLAAVTDPRPNGRVYAIGGDTATGPIPLVEAYVPNTAFWTTMAPLPGPGRYRLATATGVDPSGRMCIYAFGGFSPGAVPIANVDKYDIDGNSWVPTGTTVPAHGAFPRTDMAAATGPDGIIYVIGGRSGNVALTNVDKYDPQTNTWAAAPPLPAPPRYWLAAATGTPNLVYALGGYGPLNLVHGYDVSSSTWYVIAPMQAYRTDLTAAAGLDGKIYAIGGFNGKGSLPGSLDPHYLPQVDVFNSTFWTLKDPWPTYRPGVAAATGPDGRIYVVGGPSGQVDAYKP